MHGMKPTKEKKKNVHRILHLEIVSISHVFLIHILQKYKKKHTNKEISRKFEFQKRKYMESFRTIKHYN